MIKLTRKVVISASHRLYNEKWDDKKNKQIFGKCVGIHGHNYKIYITIEGPVNIDTGMVINITNLNSILNETVVEKLDHQHLNNLKEFENIVPTTENMVKIIWMMVEEELNKFSKLVRLEKVKIKETDKNSVSLKK
jgi:6-pyruvoyltetrahydropterin/6-carboxytetrahydropterin synthase